MTDSKNETWDGFTDNECELKDANNYYKRTGNRIFNKTVRVSGVKNVPKVVWVLLVTVLILIVGITLAGLLCLM